MTRQCSYFWLLLLLSLTMGSWGCKPGAESGGDATSIRDEITDSHDQAEPAADTPAEEQVADASAPPAETKAGWGHLKGRFTISGAPAPAKFEITKDAAYCGKFTQVDESLVVGKDGGLANVVVMLSQKRGDTPPTPHESYAASETANVLLDNIECRFVPHIVLLRTTQTLEVKNSDPDPIAHNTKIEADPPINPILPPGGMVTANFKAGRLPAPVSCSIHPWMTAKLVVKDSPYMAASDADGNFVIENLPAGEWEFQVWQERLGYVQKVNVAGSDVEWKRGMVKVSINGDATTDWGTVKIDYAKYK